MYRLMKASKITGVLFFLTTLFSPIYAQETMPGDSASFNGILKQVMVNYPAILKSIQDLRSADAQVGLAKSGYYPDISINTNYSHIGPVSTFTLPGYGTFSLYPSDNFSAMVNYSQLVYDFGETSKKVNYAKQARELADMSSEALKQKLSLAVVNVYYSVVFLQEAIRIKDEQIKTLNEHLTYVSKKEETGSATKYDVLTTEVKISAIENQKTDLETALKTVTSQMNSLVGAPATNPLLLKRELLPVEPLLSADSLMAMASRMRPEMKMAEQKTEMAKLKYSLVNNQNNPSLNLFSSFGFKNGYTPDINKEKANYVVGLGLRIPVYDAGRKKNQLVQAGADVENSRQDEELTMRSVINEVIENQSDIEAALQKITQTGLQLKQAMQAYSLAEVSFKSGVITNLELLDSSTSLSEAGLAVLKARIDYSQSVLKLKIALGEHIY